MTKHTSQPDLFQQPATPLPPRDRTHGLVVQLPESCRCGCGLAVIGEVKGPHIASLRCANAECRAHRGWVSRQSHASITEIVTKFGRPNEPIAIRRAGANCRRAV
jgi:hypothetical protein